MTNATKQTIVKQIELINEKRAALHAELVALASHLEGTEGHQDRIAEMEYLNGRLVKLIGRMAD